MKILNDVVDKFERLQIIHDAAIRAGIESLRARTNDLPDLDEINSEREEAFLELKKRFDEMSVTNGDIDDLESLRGRLADIMRKEDSLRKSIEEYRACLKESMDRMKLGRSALKGYGGGTGNGFS